ncbi:MAG TPA: sigma-70 family RNA polymerase sigma factor [Thermoanaerobaculia bacterium]|nr:sigma-70 family RNA polymerase sigma factor [Thermoanaerobaculia bacterium]
MSYDALFLNHLPQIEAIAAYVCRRYNCGTDEAEEFSAHVKAKLVADDYAILGKFQGKSRFETYLTTVITHLFLDWRNHLWGKWRPSAEAKRLGPVAVKLEELERDGLTFEESCEVLRTNHKVVLSRLELADLAAKLPPRVPRRMEGEDRLEGLAAAEPGPDERALAGELQEQRRRVWVALGKELGRLAAEDRLILKMRYEKDLKVVDIARALHVEAKPLYRRIERLERELRSALERQGIGRDAAREVLGSERE